MIKGYCDPKFKKVHDTFSNAIASGFETGATLAIEHKGEMIVNLWGIPYPPGPGFPREDPSV